MLSSFGETFFVQPQFKTIRHLSIFSEADNQSFEPKFSGLTVLNYRPLLNRRACRWQLALKFTALE